MYITHHFSHEETLNRALYWLNRFGFGPGRIEVCIEGTPRILLRATPSEAPEAELLFAALDLADPDGSPGFWHAGLPLRPPGRPTFESEAMAAHAPTALGWHPADAEPYGDPVARAFREAMGY